MKYTLETGMLIICIALLFVLVAFQYTNITNEDDTEEGFHRRRRRRRAPGNEKMQCFSNKYWPKLLGCFGDYPNDPKYCLKQYYSGNHAYGIK